uniref:28 kDa Metastriate family member n=1 Tax=Rhipicephalus zambeziensis TaxID=60191 RepID=A0A224YBQ6_9ACAR
MLRLNVVFLSVFVRGCIAVGIETSGNHPPLRWSHGDERIGKGVHLKAHVLYDARSYESMAPQKNVIEYFKEMFNKTQQHFNNHSILVSIVVYNITLNKSAEVMQEESSRLNGSATLKNLQRYARDLGLSNDSVVYLYTNKTAVDRRSFTAIPSSLSTVTTFGSFCTENSSAAIVVQQPGMDSYWRTVKATAELFGITNFINFTIEDIQTMNKTFQKCHVKKQEINGGGSDDD